MSKSIAYISALFSLTKPSITLLVLITGMAGLIVEGSLLEHPGLFVLALLFLAMASGSANGLNQYLERDRDSMMVRTRKRRPLPTGKLSPVTAVSFATTIGILAILGFWLIFNAFSALLALATILFYSLYYTLYLKPRTPQNIVIGGAAGSMGPVISWAASAGELTLTPVLMFAVIFFWTPPHFWALALLYQDDYRKIGYPMMPLVVGNLKTTSLMVIYTVWTILVSVGLIFTGAGIFYAVSAIALGAVFWIYVYKLHKTYSSTQAGKVFGVSIVYLLALFVALMIDKGLVWMIHTL